MFPRSLGFLIIILIIDAFLKNAKDKKESQKARDRRTASPDRRAEEVKDIKEKPLTEVYTERREEQRDMEKRPLSEIYLKRLEKSNDMKREPLDKRTQGREIEEITFAESTEIGDVIKYSEDKSRGTSKKDSRNKLKKDLISGIIFSEVISKPKSKQSKRKSI